MIYDSFFDSVLDSFFDNDFEKVYPNFKAPHTVKAISDNSFPASKIEVNKNTKQFRIVVSLPGISEEDIKLSRDDNLLILKIQRATKEDSPWRVIQNGFKDIEGDLTATWKIDAVKYDLESIKVDMRNGLLTITIDPNKASEPKETKVVFGKLN